MLKLDRSFYIPSAERFPDLVERKDADSSAVVYCYTGERGQPVAKMFSGKRAKPDEFIRYGSEEARESAVAKFFDRVRSRERFAVEQREQRKAAGKGARGLTIPADGYMSAPAVAAYLRTCLKEAFPGHKFSVTSDRSLRVAWTDGPSKRDVERIAGTFAGSYFDGMIDYEGAIYHSIDGQKVRFGASYVFTERTMTAEALEVGAAAMASHYGAAIAPATIEPGKCAGWSPVVTVNPDFPGACPGQWAGEFQLMEPETGESMAHFVRPELALERWHDQARPFAVQPSPTFARVAVLGTDGYGNTALEAADGGDTGRGYPRQKEPADAAQLREVIAEAEQAAVDVFVEIAKQGGLAFDVEEQRFKVAEPAPKAVDCQIIDFAPHLAAHIQRADAAKRCN